MPNVIARQERKGPIVYKRMRPTHCDPFGKLWVECPACKELKNHRNIGNHLELKCRGGDELHCVALENVKKQPRVHKIEDTRVLIQIMDEEGLETELIPILEAARDQRPMFQPQVEGLIETPMKTFLERNAHLVPKNYSLALEIALSTESVQNHDHCQESDCV